LTAATGLRVPAQVYTVISNAQTGQPERLAKAYELRGHKGGGAVFDLMWNAKRLVAAGKDRHFRIWNVDGTSGTLPWRDPSV